MKHIETIGSRIRRLLHENNMTQVMLAEITQRSVTMVHLWVSDKKKPEFLSLRRMSNKFGVSVDYIYFGDDIPVDEVSPDPIRKSTLIKDELFLHNEFKRASENECLELTELKVVVKGNNKSYVICPKMITRIEEYKTNHCIVHYLNNDSFSVYMSLDDLAAGLDIADERKATIDDDEKVFYSVRFFTVTVEVLEIHEREHYEWRLVAENGKVLHQSDIGYGSSGFALRDGILVVCDYPDSIRSAEIDKVRKILIN